MKVHLHKPAFRWILIVWVTSFACGPSQAQERRVAQRLDEIRDYPAALTAFFQDMPKGGDLHHHFSGSVYPETFFRAALRHNAYIHPASLQLQLQAPADMAGWTRLQQWVASVGYYEAERTLLRHWSAMDFSPGQTASYDDFFNSFPRFNFIVDSILAEGLLELKQRAVGDNILYIETMLERAHLPLAADSIPHWNQLLGSMQAARDTAALYAFLQQQYTRLQPVAGELSARQARSLRQLHEQLAIDEQGFAMRYQYFALRVLPAPQVFADLLLACNLATADALVVGVNIVAPEHNPVALADYWLHMHFFRFLRRQFPEVRFAMHAGELSLGVTQPEHLRWHVTAAVDIAGASRIGHGVDLPYEHNVLSLLDTLRRRSVAVEINLSSNEFILGIAGNRHPVQWLWEAGVPLVISTDDEGVLRTNLSEQYVLLAHRYPSFSYKDIKKLVYNSITYSFLKEPSVKQAMVQELDRRFAAFEARWSDR